MDQTALEIRSVNAQSRSRNLATAKTKKRPLSRTSTASVRSGTTQAVVEHVADSATADFHRQWFEQNTHVQPRFGSLGHQMTTEDIFMQSVPHLQNSREYEIDPSLGNPQHNGSLAYHQEMPFRPEMGRQPILTDVYNVNYADGDSHILDGRSDEQEEIESVAGASGTTKKASKSSAANELEMRQLFQANKHRSLPDIATELHGNERGPQSERQRQVFAMLWINQVCSKGKGSVPRGRVYSNYVSRCATERVTVLNPASFGKLVRVLFPGLKTRRLGVRGESKYHYVNFSLADDQPDFTDSQKIQIVQNTSEPPHSFVNGFNVPTKPSHQNGRRGQSPPRSQHMPAVLPQKKESYVRPHSLYHRPDVSSISQLESWSNKISQPLRFSPLHEQTASGNEPIELPKIDRHIPIGTDPDSASALTALYRSHCTSLVDALRFCKEKTFFHLFSSFHGTLTMPVQKLFSHREIAPWIEECDFAMYQKMMRVVAPLTLQVAPKPVLDSLRNISERLVSHIHSCFQGHPAHVLQAKAAPATLFAGLLDRELRVNLTAHAAANMLSNPANRDQMYEEWITMVRTRKIAECVPTRGMDDVVKVLLSELRNLLNPVNVDWELESRTLYGEMALRNRQFQASEQPESTIENVLDRWVNLLASLPAKFPYASHSEIVWCVQSVGTAVMRDITISQGKSFGAWWVTKCWIDEMIVFMAEQGGFMEQKTSSDSRRQSSEPHPTNSEHTYHNGQYNNGSDDVLRSSNNLDGSISMLSHSELIDQGDTNNIVNHDDSGIGLRTPEDDFAAAKYECDKVAERLQDPGLLHHGLSMSTLM